MTLKGLLTVGAVVALFAGCAKNNEQTQAYEEEPFTPSSNYDSLDSMDAASASYEAPASYAAPADYSTPPRQATYEAASSSGSSGGSYAKRADDEVLSPTGGQTYVVRKGDTLYALARRFYGKDSAWRDIYNANRNQLSNPNRLYAGTTLVIP